MTVPLRVSRLVHRTLPWLALGCVLLLLAATGCGEAAGTDLDVTDTTGPDTAGADAADTPPPGDTPGTTDAADTGAPDSVAPDTEVADPDADTLPEVREGLGPPYPIVLAHGMGGFEHLADLESVPYWHGVREHLEARGAVVHVTEVDPLNTSDVRGSQLLGQIELYLSQTGYARVVLVGHSQGGLDARWVAHHRPELVAAVFTVATPHLGSPVSDVVLGVVPDDRVHDLADSLVNFWGQALYDELGNESSLMAPVRLFSSEGIAEFNARITDAAGVAYYSVTGRSDDAPADEHCFVLDSPEFVDRYWEATDPIDPLLWFSETVVGSLSELPNDGLVTVESGKWGRFLGCVPADHMDEVGQLLGDAPGGENAFDHLEFYAGMADFLRAEGF